MSGFEYLWLLGVFAAIGGFWWWKVGRYGDKYYARKLGLADGETIVRHWGAIFHINRSLGSYVWEALGAGADRGDHAMIAITSTDRLVVGSLETDCKLAFARGDVFASGCHEKPKHESLRTVNGREPATVMLLSTGNGHRVALEVPKSCLTDLQAWTWADQSTGARDGR